MSDSAHAKQVQRSTGGAEVVKGGTEEVVQRWCTYRLCSSTEVQLMRCRDAGGAG